MLHSAFNILALRGDASWAQVTRHKQLSKAKKARKRNHIPNERQSSVLHLLLNRPSTEVRCVRLVFISNATMTRCRPRKSRRSFGRCSLL